MKEKFIDHKFRARSGDTLHKAMTIIDEMQQAGYVLTLRQLFYQFVRRNWIANQEKEYKRLGDVVRRGREAGYIDWDAIEDRNRTHYGFARAQTAEDAMRGLAGRVQLDPWLDQDYHVEVWVEKQALESVVGRACAKQRARYMACKGYLSTSETYDAGKRFARAIQQGRTPVMIHLGDHDPSGIDMTRDNGKRLSLFTRMGVDVRRIALNMDQIEQYDPPPNPAKVQDSRAKDYIELHGTSSWELDALQPDVLHSLIQNEIATLIDQERWDKTMEREAELQARLQQIVDADFEDISVLAERLNGNDPKLIDRLDNYDSWVDDHIIVDDPLRLFDGDDQEINVAPDAEPVLNKLVENRRLLED